MKLNTSPLPAEKANTSPLAVRFKQHQMEGLLGIKQKTGISVTALIRLAVDYALPALTSGKINPLASRACKKILPPSGR